MNGWRRPIRPEDLAQELGVDPKRLRAWLRKAYPRRDVEHGQPWYLNAEQIATARSHFWPRAGSSGGGGPGGSLSELHDLLGDPGMPPRAISQPHQTQQVGGSDIARRREAAERYRPQNVRLLLVAEAPPASMDRYFYFSDVSSHDSLFRYAVKGLYGVTPSRSDKPGWLKRLVADGVFLIDLCEEPEGLADPSAQVPGLVERCQSLRPESIIIIKTKVYDAAYSALRAAGLRVVDRRIPFPGSGQQRRFEEEFRQALSSLGF